MKYILQFDASCTICKYPIKDRVVYSIEFTKFTIEKKHGKDEIKDHSQDSDKTVCASCFVKLNDFLNSPLLPKSKKVLEVTSIDYDDTTEHN